MEFLAGHRFDVGSLFTHGVRYLSRDEEIAAREEAVRRWAPTDPMDNIEHKLRDEADIKFLEAVRCQIETWIAGGKVSSLKLWRYRLEDPLVKLSRILRHAVRI